MFIECSSVNCARQDSLKMWGLLNKLLSHKLIQSKVPKKITDEVESETHLSFRNEVEKSPIPNLDPESQGQKSYALPLMSELHFKESPEIVYSEYPFRPSLWVIGSPGGFLPFGSKCQGQGVTTP